MTPKKTRQAHTLNLICDGSCLLGTQARMPDVFFFWFFFLECQSNLF
jgi:hypothetical protein